jgi:peptide-methionine (S)-S-oxide reductase
MNTCTNVIMVNKVMSIAIKFLLLSIVAIAVGCGVVSSSEKKADLRDIAPVIESEPASQKGTQTAVFAGGCFWGVEGVFEHTKGVIDVRSGYSGGTAATANYEDVSDGKTDHAEAVKVTFDPTKVSYTQLLTIFFSVAHDPTQLNRQGPDTGRHYRSAIFFADEDQKKTANAYIASIEKAKVFDKPVVTEVVPLEKFYEAEGYHQDYMKKNPNQPYIVIHDKPKVEDLKKRFSELFVQKY